jgi:hypothetical protein
VTDWVQINYRDFWDVPRIFFAEYEGELYLFDCQFDRELEDYPNSYRAFLMPELTEEDFAAPWANLWRRAEMSLGTVAIPAVTFDPTKRAAIRADAFDAIRQPGARPAAAS